MRRFFTLCLGGLLATATFGCRDDANPPDDREAVTMDVVGARAALRALLTETAEAVAPGAAIEVIDDRDPSPCQSGQTGQDLNTESAGLDLVVSVEAGTEKAMLQDVVTEWERVEVDLNRSRLDDSDSEVLGKRPGFGVRVLAVADSGQIALTGETDCLAPAGG